MDKILLIQPDLRAREELTFLLQHLGFQVVGTAGVEQALAELPKRFFSLILIAENADSSSGANGHEGWLRIRETSQAPIIVLGRYQEEAAGVDFLEMGADGYLPTPLNHRLLVAQSHTYIRRYKITTGGV